MGKRRRRVGPGPVQVLRVSDRIIVWLHGDVESAQQRDLVAAAESVTAGVAEVVVDVSGLQFCDLAVAQFLDILIQRSCVTVRFPSTRFREFLRLTGLDASVQIQTRSVAADSREPQTV